MVPVDSPLSFACPKDKYPLQSMNDALHCTECGKTYPIINGIPDFLLGDLQAESAPVFGGTSGITTLKQMANRMDFFSTVYDSRFFGSVLLKLSGIKGGFLRFLDRVTNFHLKVFEGINGEILDVACGPATYCRRIASDSRNVYGLDISMGMLKKGKIYSGRENVPGIHLARTRVEELPFENAVFNGAMCSGALHLFPNTVASLREIARTMKPGAPLSVQTFVPGNTAVNRFVQRHSWVHTFELTELQGYLTEAGFEKFQPEVEGIVLTFSARKAV
jgi:ubiquinone/menaquinone biosynthesis C-methylase UbiE